MRCMTFRICATAFAVLISAAVAHAQTILTLGSGFDYVEALDVDADGNVYVAHSGNRAIKKILVMTPVTLLQFAVPYDFDSSGMVDAEYAAPNERLPILEVTQRLYRGFCRHGAGLGVARAEFRARREAIFALVQSEPRLNATRRRALQRYFDAFYAVLDDDARFARELTAKCRR